ncbi:MAG TPA: hypothetical protein PL033_12050 [Candidatus Brocadiia bacterium]|nr:hypothetical protein [Candidatus Brocadiia bacterium]
MKKKADGNEMSWHGTFKTTKDDSRRLAVALGVSLRGVPKLHDDLTQFVARA